MCFCYDFGFVRTAGQANVVEQWAHHDHSDDPDHDHDRDHDQEHGDEETESQLGHFGERVGQRVLFASKEAGMEVMGNFRPRR